MAVESLLVSLLQVCFFVNENAKVAFILAEET